MRLILLDMKVLVVGQGGREHAIVKALSQSHSVSEIHCVPGSCGIESLARCHDLPLLPADRLIQFCKENKINLVVVGPEDPLADGIGDQLRAAGLLVFGPSQVGAQLEASKIFAKRFMAEAQIPTARYFEVSNVSETMTLSHNFSPPWVLKADGLCAGKGVFICKTEDELRAAARSLFELRSLGAAGAKALLEEFEPGWELSYLFLTNGEDFEALPLAQDHKRLLDDDRGPNTGGMGTVAPIQIASSLDQQIREEVIKPLVSLLKKKNILYRGVVFVGLMITDRGPKTLEFNVRFGDPEIQVILPLLDGDWGHAFFEVAQGRVPRLRWRSSSAACVVLAAEGYPERPVKGSPISGDLSSSNEQSYILHAGTSKTSSGQWTTSGGRVLNSVALGKDLQSALALAYQRANQVSWAGLQMRRDIGKKVL